MKRLGKGVSPIIATIILVLIAIAAGVMLWLWVSGFITSTPAQQPALNERIKIDAVNISSSSSSSGSNLSIYVRNMGSTNVTITAAYILTTSNTAIAYSTSINVMIPPGQVTKINMNIPATASANIKPGYAYVAKVVTANGVEATYTFVWP